MKNRDADLRDEIKAHLEMATADRVSQGEEPRAAAAGARREFGNVGLIQEVVRDTWGRRWIERSIQDVRYALRVIRRNPGFALVAILSLTLGIGANAALFQVVNALRLRALPVADPTRLAEIRLVDMDGARGNFQTWNAAVTYPIWQAIAARQQAFSGVFAWGNDTFALSTDGEMRTARGLWVAGDMFFDPGFAAERGPVAERGRRSARVHPACGPEPRVLAARIRRQSFRRRPDR